MRSQQAAKAQYDYCEKNQQPHFAPPSGRCYRCGRSIYSGQFGYSVEQAGVQYITGCPYCNRSFCD